MDQLKRIIAFLFQKVGGKKLKKTRLEYLLAMELRWFSMDQAKSVFEKAVGRGYIEEKEEGFRPTFQWDKVDIPADFKPDFKELKGKPTDKGGLYDKIVSFIAGKGDLDVERIESEFAELKNEMDIIPEVLLLVIANRYGIETDKEMLKAAYERVKDYSA